jgi:uncharacterized cupredoxin-like copper-binding protein
VKNHLVGAALCVGLLGAACGSGGSTHAAAGRTENIDMTDNAYSATSLMAAKGETITFHFNNKGHLVHEAIIGDAAIQDAHAMEMSAGSGASAGGMPGMDHGGGGVSALSIAPGRSGDLTYTFDKQGTVIIGCHQPGHYEAGMKVAVAVT